MLGENFGVKKVQTINRRMFIIGAAKFVVFTGIIARLFSLQITENKKYLTLSDKNRLRQWKLPPTRGVFIDYFENVIAGNLKVYQLHVTPEEIEDFKYLMVRLKEILNISNNDFKKIIDQKNKQKPWETIIISKNLTWEQFTKVNYYLHDLVGAKPVLSVSRNYPFNESYTHVLGYVSEASEKDILNNEIIRSTHVPGLKVGKNGLEKTFEDELIGTNGIERYEVNAYGKRIKQINYQDGLNGNTIQLTIDTEVQKLCNELLKGVAGSISVMDIYTGEIVAMQSSPSFDPNLFLFGINQDDWQLIRNNPLKPLVNKTLSGLYSPGSTYKPIVALSALENGIIDENFKVNCKGKIEMYGQTYHCWKKRGHGIVDLKSAMKQSCDTYFYEIARKLGVDRLKETSIKFGLGEKVLNKTFSIEKRGLIPDTKWKKNNLGKGWVIGETLITGIGQGYTQTTPLQLCLMTAQLANGGFKIYPKIIVEEGTETMNEIRAKMDDNLQQLNLKNNGSQVDAAKLFGLLKNKKYEPLFKNSKNIKLVRDAMFASTNEVRGTSYKSRIEDPKYQFAGKTGTSQVKRITERQRELELKTIDIPYNERDHALYVAFGPYKNPRYALSIVVEHGGSGSSAAAPIAKKLFKLIIDRHELREQARDKKTNKV
ncbi:penicillin-binding protein 2 [Candidatus Pelagibacter ubique]|nr:penicillin-binding protein 2 [Candidatus Pelagibacter ubique]MDA7480589.1 penicillin-binding protein 2 [Candidatus Pelagibacter ubique]MDA7487396.1 penicillin-binding protein 2 [Candidatus Pelagibacter ubique]MDC1540840.1 penicillin-binding protein 2 [Candidatus Pelagibacter ubique]